MLVAVVAATYAVVEHNVGGSTPVSHAGTRTVGTHGTSTRGTGRKPAVGARFYTVRSGDSLSVISARTGVPLPTLQGLNPQATTRPLQVGERLRLRR